MLQLFDRAPVSMSREEILSSINRYNQAIDTLRDELGRRGPIDNLAFGYPAKSEGYRVFSTFPEATSDAVKYFKDAEAGYNVIPVYLDNGQVLKE